MGFLKAMLLESYVLFGITNKLMRPVTLPLTRLYATLDDKRPEDLKKERKLAKKLAILAAEPQYFQIRSNKWTELKQKYDKQLAANVQKIINVTLLDGKIVEGFSYEVTPLDVAKGLSHSLASEVYLAKIDNELWDLERPLESDCKIELIKFDSQDAKAAYWTTAACTLAEALERLYCTDDGGMVCNIGSTQTGFFADTHLKHKTINRKDIAAIEEGILKILSGMRVKVDRIVVSKSDAIELFSYNPLKLKTINERLSDSVPIYRCGSFIEISDTPLIRHNKKVNAVKVLKIESVIWNGEPVQRIHGISFPSTKELKDFLKHNKMTLDPVFNIFAFS